jgi:lipoprotein-releasing system ATP-binding protein
VLEVRSVSKEYDGAGGRISVLSGVDLQLNPGDSASVVGPSGSGKSTLLYIVGTLEPPTSGTVMLNGRNPFDLDEKSLSAFRNEQVGFVFQDHHLLPQCTVLENVLIPTLITAEAARDAERRARDLIEQVGLSSRIDHRPHQLSGGEKQRVAIARALIRKPHVVLCDEPTGNLDQESTEAVADLLLHLHHTEQTILVVVTHNLELAARFSQRYKLAAARLCPLVE